MSDLTNGWQILPGFSSTVVWVLWMQEWFMNVFYAQIPRHSEVVPCSAVVLCEPHLRMEDLGRGRRPDCAVVLRPQMFGTQRGNLSPRVGTCPLCVDSCSEPAWPREAAGKWRRFTPAVLLAGTPPHSSGLTQTSWHRLPLLIASVQKCLAVSHQSVKLRWCIQWHMSLGLFTTCDDKNALFICFHYEWEDQSHLVGSTIEPVEWHKSILDTYNWP